MFEHQSKCKAMALALVAMLAFCSVSVMMTDSDAAANNNETYTINLRVGDTFSYTPQVNLTDNVVITVDSSSDAGMSDCYNSGTGEFKFKPTASGTKTVKFKATWNSGSMYQYAYQTIEFHVYTGLTVNGGQNPTKTISSESPSGTVIYTPNITGGIPDYTYTVTIPAALQGFMRWDGSKLVTTGTIPSSVPSSTPYTVTIKATDAGLSAGDKTNKLDKVSVTITLGLTITDKYTISVQPDFETFAGELGDEEQRETSFPVSTNKNVIGGVTSETITPVATDSSGTVNGLVSYSNGRINVDVSKAVFSDGQVYRDYTVRITANAVSTTVGNITASADVNLRIYSDLYFISEPTIDGAYASRVADSALDILMTATFTNADRITYDWGDGNVTNVNGDGSDSSTYSARHVYGSTGTYFITIYAENERGTAKLVTIYNTGDETGSGTDSPSEGSFFDEHGYQFVIFAVIALIAFAAFFFFGIQSRVVMITAMVSATLSVVTFVCGDLSGVVEVLKGLL